MLEEIKKNINEINSGIRSENLFDHGTLIAVSKKKEYELIKEAYQNGIRDFGENYAQELNDKATKANADGINISWHFIGPIQSNKIALIAKNAQWVHSISRLKEIEKLNNECGLIGKKLMFYSKLIYQRKVLRAAFIKIAFMNFLLVSHLKRIVLLKALW